MSIYKQNIDPIALTESDADEFLRDMDITLYEDTMVIEGTEYEGTYGEEVLAENGIFLYDDGIVLEGKQAEEYKARKAKEKLDAEASDELRVRKRGNYQHSKDRALMGILNSEVKKNPKKLVGDVELDNMNSRAEKDAARGSSAWNRTVWDERNRRSKEYGYSNNLERGNNILRANDAANRHKRRHPKQYAKPKNESTIFSDIDII